MHLRTPSDLGATIREQRRRLNLDQSDLAKQVGVSRKWIIDVEKGKARAEVGLILRTLDVLGLRLSLDQVGATQGDQIQLITTPNLDTVLERARGRDSDD